MGIATYEYSLVVRVRDEVEAVRDTVRSAFEQQGGDAYKDGSTELREMLVGLDSVAGQANQALADYLGLRLLVGVKDGEAAVAPV